MVNRLAEARARRGWKKVRLVVELRKAATRKNETLPKDESLLRRIAAWENQDGGVSEFYRGLFCDVYSCKRSELFLDTYESTVLAPDMPELPAAFSLSKIDGGLVELLRGHTQSLRMIDRRLGSSAAYEQTVAHVNYVEELVRFALPGVHREAAADELGQAAALAGWQALDSGRTAAAWRHHELAAAASRESAVPSGLAYSSAQQAYVLLELGHLDEALALVRGARERLGGPAPRELWAWLHAAEGEILAAQGNRNESLRALDRAERELPSSPQNALPYVMLDPGHLARWRGHCLARLGESSAIEDLTTALSGMEDGRYGRAEVGARVDLALALQRQGELAESKKQARMAEELAGKTGSERQRRRIAELLSA